MNITKFGHCCLLIEENGRRIITDPGTYSSGQDEAQRIDLIVISHAHQDHFSLPSVKKILENNPQAIIVTNKEVGTQLDKEGIAYISIEDGESTEQAGITIEGFGTDHAAIYGAYPGSANTGYFIAEKLFFPGDAFVMPNKPVEILALPIAGPWMKIAEAIDYAKVIKPKTTFPIHEAMMKNPEFMNPLITKLLEAEGVTFVGLEIGKETAF